MTLGISGGHGSSLLSDWLCATRKNDKMKEEQLEKKTAYRNSYQRQCGAVNHDAFGKADTRWIISQLCFLGRAEQSGFARRLHITHVHRKANDIKIFPTGNKTRVGNNLRCPMAAGTRRGGPSLYRSGPIE